MKSGYALFPSIVLMTHLCAAHVCAESPRPDDFGRQWVRAHPLTIMGQTLRAESVTDDKYSQCGFNAMFAWEKPEGILVSAVRQKLIPAGSAIVSGALAAGRGVSSGGSLEAAGSCASAWSLG